MNLRNSLSLYGLCGILLFSGCKKENSSEPVVNNKPVLARVTANPQEMFPGKSSILECIVEDDDNSYLSYSWDKDKGYFESNNGKRVTWHAPDEVGEYHITVSVEDREENWSDSRIKNLTVVSQYETRYSIDNVCINDSIPYHSSQNPLTSNDDFLGLSKDQLNLLKIYLKFDSNLNNDHNIKSINLKLTRKFEDFEYNSPLNCYLFEITEDWNENVINSNNEPDYNILPVKYFKIPILGDNESFLLDITGIDLQYGFFVFPLEDNIYRSFYSREGAQEAGNMNYSPSLMVEYE